MFWVIRNIKDYIDTIIGTPADTDVSTDIANIYTDTQSLGAKDGGAFAVTTNGTIVQSGATGQPNIVLVTTSATPNTFGAWTLIRLGSGAESWIANVTVMVKMFVTTAYMDKFCVEIGTGDTPATKIRFSFCDEKYGESGFVNSHVFTLPIPIRVAAGTKISVRASCVSSGVTTPLYIGLSLYQNL
jgi:hypothetical protein